MTDSSEKVTLTSKASDDLAIVTNWQQLLGLIDKVWNAATESEEVPHHEWASRLINDWMPEQPPGNETGERLNRLQLERLALQAINSLPCPDAEPLAKALDDQFERITGYRTKNWPHGAETMRLERAHAQKALEPHNKDGTLREDWPLDENGNARVGFDLKR